LSNKAGKKAEVVFQDHNVTSFLTPITLCPIKLARILWPFIVYFWSPYLPSPRTLCNQCCLSVILSVCLSEVYHSVSEQDYCKGSSRFHRNLVSWFSLPFGRTG